MWGESSEFIDFSKSIGLTEADAALVRTCQSVGLVGDTHKSAMLTFAENQKFTEQALENSSTQTLICSEMPLSGSSKYIVFVSNPRFVFWSLVEYMARKKEWKDPSIIADSAILKPGAIVSRTGCVLESEVVIEEGAIVLPGVRIGRNTVIGAGSVIGSDGLEVKETIFGRVRVTHDAGVTIENDVTIGAGCTVNRGLLGQDTQIGRQTKIDSGVHIAHSCKIGPRNTIAANVTFGGAVVTEKEVFVGLNATVVNAVTLGDRCFIGAGSVVVRSIDPGIKVLPHPSRFLALP